MLDPKIIIFANTYMCPLGTRCTECVFESLLNVGIEEVYHTVKGLEEQELLSLARQCQVCQDEYCCQENLRAKK